MNTPALTIRLDYTNLWKLLIEKHRNREDLKREAGVSAASIARLNKSENVTTNTLLRICEYLDCTLADIGEIVPIKEAQINDQKGPPVRPYLYGARPTT